MNSSGLISDNVAELLVKILDFTIARHKILSENINSMYSENFTPMDLPVEEFAALMEFAVVEHKKNKRLLLCDTENVKFGLNGAFNAEPVLDENARKLLALDTNEYLEFELKKLSENSINQKIAAELLKQKQGMLSILSDYKM